MLKNKLLLSLLCLLYVQAKGMLSEFHPMLDEPNVKAIARKKIKEIQAQGKTFETYMFAKYKKEEDRLLQALEKLGFTDAVKGYKQVPESMDNYPKELVIENQSKKLNEHQLDIIERLAKAAHLKGPLIIKDYNEYDNAAASVVVSKDGEVKHVIEVNRHVKNLVGTLLHEFGHIYLLHPLKLRALRTGGVVDAYPEEYQQLSRLHEFQADAFFALQHIKNALAVTGTFIDCFRARQSDEHPSGMDRYKDNACIVRFREALGD